MNFWSIKPLYPFEIMVLGGKNYHISIGLDKQTFGL